MVFMEKEFVPATITAVAGICGIFLNICINTVYRMLDSHDKRRAQKIESLETYYIPLSNRMRNLSRLVYRYEIFSKEKASMEKFINYCNETESVPANQKKVFGEIKTLINDTYEFLQNNKHHYLNDFKTEFYFDKISQAFNIIHHTIKNKSPYQNDKFSFKYIEEFVNRIDIMTVSLYSRNILHCIYLRLWVHKMQSK